MTPELEEKLVSQAQAGNRLAFEELARLTWRLVYAHHVLETGDRHAAEDLTQETLLSAVRSLGELRSPRGFRTWVLHIARNVATDAARRAKAQRRGGTLRPVNTVADRAAHESTPEQSAADAEQRHAALTALRGLPEEYRLPLSLRLLVGADHATICQQTGLSDGAVRGLLYRGMKLLRERFAQSVPASPDPSTPAASLPSVKPAPLDAVSTAPPASVPSSGA